MGPIASSCLTLLNIGVIYPPYQAAVAISRWLGEQCIYRHDIPLNPNDHIGSTAIFCFDPEISNRQGNCQLFASACTLLLRASGHPALYCGGLTPRVARTHSSGRWQQ